MSQVSETTFTCDKCLKTQKAVVCGLAPKGWRQVRLVIDTWDSSSFDLCEECAGDVGFKRKANNYSLFHWMCGKVSGR